MPVVPVERLELSLRAAALAVCRNSAAPRSTRISRTCSGEARRCGTAACCCCTEHDDRRIGRFAARSSTPTSRASWPGATGAFPDAAATNCFAHGRAARRRRRLPARRDGGSTPPTPAGSTFPAGTPDPDDVVGAAVDLDGSVRRELARGNRPDAATSLPPTPGWHAVLDGPRIALHEDRCGRARSRRACARASSASWRGERQPELCDIRIVRGPPISIR